MIGPLRNDRIIVETNKAKLETKGFKDLKDYKPALDFERHLSKELQKELEDIRNDDLSQLGVTHGVIHEMTYD